MSSNPEVTVAAVVERDGRFLIVEERIAGRLVLNQPAGHLEDGETLIEAAVREAREETNLEVTLGTLLGVYSDPGRDPRFHTCSVVYVATGEGVLRGGDDASEARVFQRDRLPPDIAFDHRSVLEDYWRWKETGITPHPSRHPRGGPSPRG